MKKYNQTLLPLVWSALFACCGMQSALATGTVTTATGGSAISADTASGAYTSLSGPVIVESNDAGMSTGTMVLNAPAGFEFDTTADSVTLTVTGTGIPALPTNQTATPTSSNITMTISVGSLIPLDRSTFTWSGIKVRPTSGTPLASGNITYGGTSTGVTGGANMGTLTKVAGAPTAVRVETLATGAGTVVPAQNVSASSTVTGYAIVRDQFGNFVTNVAANAWSLVNNTGGVVSGDLVPAGNSKSAVFTGHLVGSASINVTSGSLTSTDSGTLTVVPSAPNKLVITTAPQALTAGVVSSVITVQVQDVGGNPTNATARTVNLTKSSASGIFRNESDTATITSISIPAGVTSTNFLFKDTLAGTTTITTAATGLTSANQAETIVASTPTMVRVETTATGSGVVVATQSITSGNSLTAYAISRDAFTNFVANVAADAWSLPTKTTNVVDGDLIPAGDSKSAVFTAHGTGTAVISATSGALTAINSGTLTVAPAAATKVIVLLPGETLAPGTVTGKTGTTDTQTAGTGYTITVRAVDLNWNPVSSTRTIAITTSDANDVLPANAALVAGVKTFSLTNKTAGSWTITATDTSANLAPYTTAPVTFNPGAFTKLQVLAPGETANPGSASGATGSPSAQISGNTFNVIVRAVDANFNLVDTAADTVAITASDANAVLPGNNALVAGLQTFSVTINAGGTNTVTATDVTDGAKTADVSAGIPISAGVFAKLQVLMPGETLAAGTATGKTGTPTAQAAGVGFSVTVRAVDASWNLVSTNDTIHIVTSDGAATMPANAALTAGTRAFTVTNKTAGLQNFTASNVTHPAITSDTGSDVLITPGAASKLTITTQPSAAATASVAFVQQPVVNVLDAFNNLRTNDSSTIVFARRIAGSGTLSGTTNATAVNGVATYTDLASAVATNITIAFSSGSLTAVTSSIVAVSPNAFTQLLALLPGETHAPGTLTGKTGTAAAAAGSNTLVRVLATDANFNLVDTVTDTVAITCSDPNATLPSDVALLNGTNTFSLVFKTAGSRTVTATDVTDGTKTASTDTVTVAAGIFARLQLLVPGESAVPGTATGKTGTPVDQTAGTPFSAKVNGVDSNWNLVTTASGGNYTIQITSSDTNATLPGNANLLNGTNSYSVTLRTVGAWTVTAIDTDAPTITNISPAITVNVGAANKLLVLLPGETAAPGTATGKIGTPTAQAAGVPFNVTVRSVDAAWNSVSSSDTVHLVSNDANADAPADIALVGGVATFSVTLKTAGSRTVTASDVTTPAITANTSSALTLNPAAYAALQVIMPGETAAPGTATGKTGTPTARVAGTSFNTLTVNAVDAFWNLVPTNATVAITSSDTNAILPASSALGTDGTKNNFLFTFKTAGNETITATDVANAARTNTSAITVVSPGAYTKLQILVPGETAAPGSTSGKIGTPLVQGSNVAFTVTVKGVDANWNLISTNDTVRISANDTNAILPATNALAVGTQTFNVTLNTLGTNLTVTGSNLTHTLITAATSAAITVNAKQAQTITFDPLPNKTYGDPAFALGATASSGLPVSFSIVSGPATISGGTNVTLTGSGFVIVRASQAGDAAYNPAPNVDQSFTVNPLGGVPTIAAIPDQIVYVDEPALVELLVSDAETPTNLLSLTLSTSNPALVDTNKDVLIRWFADGGPSFMPRWYATIAPTFGQIGTATNTVTVSDGANSASATFVLTVVPPPAGAARFANTNQITLPASGVASQYPSTMAVTGMVGTVTNVVVSFSRFSHENPNDLHMLLVSPSGQGMVIWSKVGGGGPSGGVAPDHAVTNVTATLTDAAPDFAPLPDFYYLWTERFRPADYAAGNPPTNDFPAPALAGPYAPTLVSNALHNAFNGQAPNGTWSLYIYDDQAPYTGSIAGGWSLTVATSSGPSISDIVNQSIVVNSNTGALPFVINDPNTAVSNLVLTASSSNTNLVTTNNIVFGGSGTNRTVTVTPNVGQTGAATITITVSDGVDTASDSFLLTVGTFNTPPSITPITDKTTLVGRPVGPFDVSATDVETPGSVILSGTSSDTNLVPNANIVFYNGPGQRTLTVTPTDGVSGTATITVSASDGTTNSLTTFLLTVSAPGGATSLFDNTNAISLPFQGTAATYPSTINVSGHVGLVTKVTLLLKDLNHSASQDLNMLLVGPGGQKVVVFANISGGATTNAAVNLDDAAAYALPPLGYTALSGTYRPTDGGHGTFPAPAPGETYASALSAFNGASPNGGWSLYVFNNPTGTGSGNIARGWSLAITTDTTNTAPAITAISNQSTTVNTATAALPFTISDVETAASNLVVTATSSDTNLVAISNIILGGTETNRTVTVTPTSNQLGTATVTLTVSDGALTASNSFTLTVNPAALTVTADNFTRVYGEANPVFTGNLVGVQAGDNITASFTTTADTNSAVGTYPITVTLSDPGSKLGNYVVTTNAGTLTVTNAILLVTANNDAKSYDGLGYVGGNGVSYAGFVNGETSAVLGGALIYGGTSQGATNAGSYSITPSGLTSGNYAINYAGGNLSINPVSITATADAKSKTYGAADPALTYQITSGALVGGDTLSGALARNAGENTGTYAITQGTLAASVNYNLSFVGANLTINAADLTVTADAKSKTYGVGDPALTYQITSGALVGSDTLSGALTRDAGESTGAHAITQGTLAASTNYILSFVGASLTINAADLTVTADSKSKTYGAADPALTYQITSGALVGSDTLSGALTRDAGENTGSYAITQGTLAASTNYNLSFVGANLTINTAGLTITADAKSKTYGAGDPALTYQITSGALVGGDTLSGALTRDAGENTGAHAITQGTLAASANYNLSFVGANLTINAAGLTVTADAKSKTYGAADPALTYQITSGALVGSDTLSGTLARNAGENTGSYPITQGTLAASTNYNLSFVGANLTVNAAGLTVTADAKSKTYGAADPALTYQITSGALVGSDTLSGALTRDAGENAGAHAITQGTLAASTNYNLAFVGANLTIDQASSLTAIASSQNPSSAGSNVTFTATISPVAPATTTPTGNVQFLTNGVAAGSPVTLVSGGASFSTAQLPAGTNAVTAQYLGDSNYLGSSDSLAQVVNIVAQTPSIVGIVKNGDGSVTVTFAGTAGAEYYVQATTNLAAPGSWENVSTNTANIGGQWNYTDTTAPSQAQRFFRAAKP